MIDRELVVRKIDLIQEDLDRLSEFGDITLEQIESDHTKEALIERYLERIITRAIDLNQHIAVELESKLQRTPKDYKDSFIAMGELGVLPYDFARRISDSAGFRNVLVHEYDDLDREKFYKSMKAALEQFPQYCQHILEFLKNQNEEK